MTVRGGRVLGLRLGKGVNPTVFESFSQIPLKPRPQLNTNNWYTIIGVLSFSLFDTHTINDLIVECMLCKESCAIRIYETNLMNF